MATRKKKKSAAPKRRPTPNPLTLKLELTKLMAVEQGTVYEVSAKGTGKHAAALGHVTARTEADAKKKATLLAKRALG